jgi:phosphate transport system substrate-binding protein
VAPEAVGGEELSGSIAVSGSSTAEPISTLVASKFGSENPGVSISVDGPGAGDGFELFCEGETDISDASRPIEAEFAAPAQLESARRSGASAGPGASSAAGAAARRS